jgi:hypothetical protein
MTSSKKKARIRYFAPVYKFQLFDLKAETLCAR